MEQKIYEIDDEMIEWIKSQNEWVKGHLSVNADLNLPVFADENLPVSLS
jgi:hypothetical protein